MKNIDIFKLLGIEKQRNNIFDMDNTRELENIIDLKNNLKPLIPSYKSIEYTKYNEPVLLVKPVDLNAYSLVFRLFNGVNRFEMYLINDDDILEIADIKVLQESEFRKGYGTFLIQKAIKLAKSQNKNKICGYMAFNNKDHHQRQIAFYKKNGFTILEDNINFEMVFN